MSRREADHPRQVRHDPDRGRFEIEVDGETAFLEYGIAEDGTVVIRHTEVPPAAEGQGVGAALARAALDRARAEGQRVRVTCPFVAAYLHRYPEYSDIVQ